MISPVKAVMCDQSIVERQENGIKVPSLLNKEEIDLDHKTAVETGSADILFVTPEAANSWFRTADLLQAIILLNNMR